MIAPHPSAAPIFLGFAVLIVAIQATIDRASWLASWRLARMIVRRGSDDVAVPDWAGETVATGIAILRALPKADRLERRLRVGRFFGVAASSPPPEDHEAEDAPRRDAGASIPFWPTSMVDALDEPIRFVPTGRAEPREGAFVAELTVIGGAR